MLCETPNSFAECRTAYHIFPAIIRLSVVWSLPLDFRVQTEEGFGDGELSFDLLDTDSVIDQGQETSMFGCFYKFFCDLFLSTFKVYAMVSFIRASEFPSSPYLSGK